MARQAVVDIETLSTTNQAVVTRIGMVAFNRRELLEEEFIEYSMTLDVQEQINNGRVIDAGTLQFWFEQDKEVREKNVICSPQQEPVLAVIDNLVEWIMMYSITHLWGNGSSFDNIILKSLFHSFGMRWPFAYDADRDLRTLFALADVVPRHVSEDKVRTKDLKSHDALDDAKKEARMLSYALRKLESRYVNPFDILDELE